MSALFSSMTAQEVSVSASFDTTHILIGDQTGFTFTVDQPSDITLHIPEFRDTLIKNIEVLAGPVTDTTIKDAGNIRITERYLVTSFDSGSYVIDPVFAELSGEEGLKRFYSDYSYLRVMRVNLTPPDTTTGIFDIVAPYRAPVTAAEVLPWVLIATVAAVILWFIIRMVKRLRKKDAVQVEPVITDPPHVIAFRELEKLRDGQLWQKGEVKLYYSRLTEILRKYIEDRYGVFSLELTTDETLRALVRTGFKRDAVYDLLRLVLTDADLVKFAKHKPSPADHDICFSNAWQFVTETVEKPVEETAPGNTKDEKKMEARG
jgi:DNA-binding transcriptional ArsR family regulator